MQKNYKNIIVAAFAILALLHLKSVQAQDANASIDYSLTTGRTIKTGAFGLNLFRGFDPNTSGTPGNDLYKAGMNMMKPGMVRYHSWEMFGSSEYPNGWLKADGEWDADKIAQALNNTVNYPLVMMNIPAWPSKWQDAEEKLLPEHYDDYARWCASLVKIINVDNHKGFKYWEVTNERDDRYQTNSDELGRIFNIAAAAMKTVDPAIKVGGPAFARPDLLDRVGAFFSTAAPNLDFVSYHSYANGSPNAPVNEVYNRAAYMASFTTSIRNEFEKYSSRSVEYFHDEYNISWNPPDPHQSNHVSMIFDAIFMVSAVKEGADGTMAWNEADGWYGKMSGNFDLRPSAYMFGNFNSHLIGGVVNKSTVSDSTSLVVLASSKGSLRQLIVINRSNKDQNYKFSFNGLPSAVTGPTMFSSYQNISNGGTVTGQLSYYQLSRPQGVLFPANTVTILAIDLNNLVSSGDSKPPKEPKWIKVRSKNDHSVHMYWKEAKEKKDGSIKYYEIFQDGKLIGTSDATHFVATWLDPLTTYIFTVKAFDATGYESPLSKPLVVTTNAYTPVLVPTIFNATTWINNFSGNVLSDAGQTTSGSSSSQLRQNDALRVILTNTPQYEPVYTANFTNPIDISYNTKFSVDIKSNQTFALRAKLFDTDGNIVDKWQNYIWIIGDNTYHTYTLSFSNAGFDSVDPTKIKGIQLMYPDGAIVNATLFFDNLQLGGKSPTFTGNYKIIAKHSGKAVSVPAASTADGVQLAQFTYNGDDNQHWKIVPVGAGYYKVVAQHSNKVMHVENGAWWNGAAIQQWTDNGSDAQKWSFEEVSDEVYKITSKPGGKSLDIDGYSMSDGGTILQWDYHGNDNQKFYIIPVDSASAASEETNDLMSSSLAIYPNPSKGKVYVSFSLDRAAEVVLNVVDHTSRIRLTKLHLGRSGKNIVELSLDDCVNGFYYVKITTETKTITKRILLK